MKLKIAALIVISLSFVTANAAEETSSFPMNDITAFDAKLSKGTVTITSTDTNMITVEQDFSSSDKTTPARKNCSVTFKQYGNTLKYISTNSGSHAECDVTLTVSIPKQFTVKTACDTGSINVSGIENNVTAETQDGNIALNKLTADTIDIKSKNGGIKGQNISTKAISVKAEDGNVHIDGLTGTADVESRNGSIELAWASAPKSGEVSISAADGNVTLTFPQDTKFSSQIKGSRQTVENDFTSAPDGFGLYVKTSDGRVKIIKSSR